MYPQGELLISCSYLKDSIVAAFDYAKRRT
jgi:hypothetical protein